MDLPIEVITILKKHGILNEASIINVKPALKSAEISEVAWANIENGKIILKLINIIEQNKVSSMVKEFLKSGTNSTLYSWNVIFPILESYGIVARKNSFDSNSEEKRMAILDVLVRICKHDHVTSLLKKYDSKPPETTNHKASRTRITKTLEHGRLNVKSDAHAFEEHYLNERLKQRNTINMKLKVRRKHKGSELSNEREDSNIQGGTLRHRIPMYKPLLGGSISMPLGTVQNTSVAFHLLQTRVDTQMASHVSKISVEKTKAHEQVKLRLKLRKSLSIGKSLPPLGNAQNMSSASLNVLHPIIDATEETGESQTNKTIPSYMRFLQFALPFCTNPRLTKRLVDFISLNSNYLLHQSLSSAKNLIDFLLLSISKAFQVSHEESCFLVSHKSIQFAHMIITEKSQQPAAWLKLMTRQLTLERLCIIFLQDHESVKTFMRIMLLAFVSQNVLTACSAMQLVLMILVNIQNNKNVRYGDITEFKNWLAQPKQGGVEVILEFCESHESKISLAARLILKLDMFGVGRVFETCMKQQRYPLLPSLNLGLACLLEISNMPEYRHSTKLKLCMVNIFSSLLTKVENEMGGESFQEIPFIKLADIMLKFCHFLLNNCPSKFEQGLIFLRKGFKSQAVSIWISTVSFTFTFLEELCFCKTISHSRKEDMITIVVESFIVGLVSPFGLNCHENTTGKLSSQERRSIDCEREACEEFLSQNINTLLNQHFDFPFPLSKMIVPYLQRLVGSGYSHFDLIILESCAYHDDLDVITGVACVNLLFEFCVTDVIFGSFAGDVLVFILARYAVNIQMQETANLVAEKALNLYVSLEEERLELLCVPSKNTSPKRQGYIEDTQLLVCNILSKISSLGWIAYNDKLHTHLASAAEKIQIFQEKAYKIYDEILEENHVGNKHKDNAQLSKRRRQRFQGFDFGFGRIIEIKNTVKTFSKGEKSSIVKQALMLNEGKHATNLGMLGYATKLKALARHTERAKDAKGDNLNSNPYQERWLTKNRAFDSREEHNPTMDEARNMERMTRIKSIHERGRNRRLQKLRREMETNKNIRKFISEKLGRLNVDVVVEAEKLGKKLVSYTEKELLSFETEETEVLIEKCLSHADDEYRAKFCLSGGDVKTLELKKSWENLDLQVIRTLFEMAKRQSRLNARKRGQSFDSESITLEVWLTVLKMVRICPPYPRSCAKALYHRSMSIGVSSSPGMTYLTFILALFFMIQTDEYEHWSETNNVLNKCEDLMKNTTAKSVAENPNESQVNRGCETACIPSMKWRALCMYIKGTFNDPSVTTVPHVSPKKIRKSQERVVREMIIQRCLREMRKYYRCNEDKRALNIKNSYQLMKSFQKHDLNGSGEINRSQFRSALADLGFKEKQIQSIDILLSQLSAQSLIYKPSLKITEDIFNEKDELSDDSINRKCTKSKFTMESRTSITCRKKKRAEWKLLCRQHKASLYLNEILHEGSLTKHKPNCRLQNELLNDCTMPHLLTMVNKSWLNQSVKSLPPSVQDLEIDMAQVVGDLKLFLTEAKTSKNVILHQSIQAVVKNLCDLDANDCTRSKVKVLLKEYRKLCTKRQSLTNTTHATTGNQRSKNLQRNPSNKYLSSKIIAFLKDEDVKNSGQVDKNIFLDALISSGVPPEDFDVRKYSLKAIVAPFVSSTSGLVDYKKAVRILFGHSVLRKPTEIGFGTALCNKAISTSNLVERVSSPTCSPSPDSHIPCTAPPKYKSKRVLQIRKKQGNEKFILAVVKAIIERSLCITDAEISSLAQYSILNLSESVTSDKLKLGEFQKRAAALRLTKEHSYAIQNPKEKNKLTDEIRKVEKVTSEIESRLRPNEQELLRMFKRAKKERDKNKLILKRRKQESINVHISVKREMQAIEDVCHKNAMKRHISTAGLFHMKKRNFIRSKCTKLNKNLRVLKQERIIEIAKIRSMLNGKTLAKQVAVRNANRAAQKQNKIIALTVSHRQKQSERLRKIRASLTQTNSKKLEYKRFVERKDVKRNTQSEHEKETRRRRRTRKKLYKKKRRELKKRWREVKNKLSLASKSNQVEMLEKNDFELLPSLVSANAKAKRAIKHAFVVAEQRRSKYIKKIPNSGAHIHKGVRKSINIIKAMNDDGYEASASTYAALIKAHATADDGDPQVAEKTLDEMKTRGVEPTHEVYHSLIEAWGNDGEPQEAKRVFENMIKAGIQPTESTWCCLIRSSIRGGSAVELAEQILDEMVCRNCQPSSQTYNEIIKAYADRGDYEKARAVIDQMWEEGIPRDVFSWNAILRASLASSPDKLATEKILDEMWEDGVDPIASSYNMIIESYAAESNIVECQRLLKLMLEYGIKPNTKSFLPIVQVFAGVDPEKAYQIIKDMQRQNIEPDVEMYNLLIDAWAQKGSVKRASQIVAEMKREGIFPNEWTLSSLVRGNFAGMHSLHTVEKFVIRLQRAYRTKKEHRDAEIARLNSHLKLYENDFSFPKPLEDNEFNFDVC